MEPVRNVMKRQFQSTNYFKVKPDIDEQRQSETIGYNFDEECIAAQQLQVKSANQKTSKHENMFETNLSCIMYN